MQLDLAWNLLVLVLVALGSQAAGSIPAPAQSLLVAPGVTEPSINDALLVPPPSAGSGFRDCNNDPSQQGCTTSGLVLVQAPFDPVTACPDTPLLGSGLDTGSIADQVSLCINAIRSNPDAFACQYPCNYTEWRDSVVNPPRGTLTSTGTNGSVELTNAAVGHSTDMAINNYFSHVGSNNSTLQDRAQQAGFLTFPLGENIAAGYNSVLDTALAWMCSDGHRVNLMGCGFDTLGTGVAINDTSAYKIYYTQDFGCSRDDYDCTCPEEPAGFEPEPAPVCSAETNAQTATTAGSPEPTTVAPAPPATTTAAPVTTTAAPTTTTAAPTTTRGAKPSAVCSDETVHHALNNSFQL
eukprot:jgi/Astpho2/6853/Aster-x0744